MNAQLGTDEKAEAPKSRIARYNGRSNFGRDRLTSR
jgi:hypothetical protein